MTPRRHKSSYDVLKVERKQRHTLLATGSSSHFHSFFEPWTACSMLLVNNGIALTRPRKSEITRKILSDSLVHTEQRNCTKRQHRPSSTQRTAVDRPHCVWEHESLASTSIACALPYALTHIFTPRGTAPKNVSFFPFPHARSSRNIRAGNAVLRKYASYALVGRAQLGGHSFRDICQFCGSCCQSDRI